MSSKKAKRPNASTSKASASENRREALRNQQAVQARQKRNARILAIVAGVIALAIVAVVGIVAWQDWKTKKEQREREANVQMAPPNAFEKNKGIVVNPEAKDAKYKLDVYIDYQCPYCADTDKALAPAWKELMADGTVQMRVHTMTFMNAQARSTHSTDLAIGAACADTVGKYYEFHNAAFENQQKTIPLYSDEMVKKTIPDQAGITGADRDKWQSCFDNKSTSQFVREVEENAGKDGVTGTPTIKVNGKNPKVKNDKGEEVAWWANIDTTKEAWEKGMADAAK